MSVPLLTVEAARDAAMDTGDFMAVETDGEAKGLYRIDGIMLDAATPDVKTIVMTPLDLEAVS